jgi:lytic murein transglycosylase
MKLRNIALALIFALFALVPFAAEAADDQVTAYKRAVEQSFAAWLEALWPDAQAAGVSRKTFEAQLKGIKLDWSLPQIVPPDPAYPDGPALPAALKPKPRHQAEFDIPELYFGKSALNSLAATGRTKYKQLGQTLGAIQQNYGVPASVIVAIWGRETGFGAAKLPYDAITAIATQGFMGRRPEVFRQEIIAALKIIEEGHAQRGEMKSSWAGAMGYTQFLPSDFDKYGVDFDGDGRRDIWGNPADIFASIANYLAKAGWNDRYTWGRQVQLPEAAGVTAAGLEVVKPLTEWHALGIRRSNGGELPMVALDAALLQTDEGEGPAYLVYHNFRVLMAWNRSTYFALTVGELADLISIA